MNFAEMYYYQIYGHYPYDSEKPLEKTQKVIDYLKDAGISNSEILKVIEEAPRAEYLTPDMLPEWLWEGSLLEKGVFYYHHLLHIKPEAPTLDPRTGRMNKSPFFLEMKIRFTLDDLVEYFYRRADIPPELRNYNKDRGALKNMLERYSRIDFAEPLDFVLTLIDIGAEDEYAFLTSPFDTTEYAKQAYDLLKARAQEAELAGANKIIWR